MTTHTPGKWEALAPKKLGKRWKVFAHGRTSDGTPCMWNLATIDNGAPGDTLETEGANARLFAAAPKLLAVVEEFMTHEGKSCLIEGPGKWCGECLRCKARAAIAKVKGQST